MRLSMKLLLCVFLCVNGVAIAGTYKNNCGREVIWTEGGKTKRCFAGEECEAYTLLDQIESCVQKISDEPYFPLSYSFHAVNEASAGNYTVGIYLDARKIKVVNLGSTEVRLHANSASNPYHWLLRQADANNKSDEITINNDNSINQLIVECTDASGCNVAIWEVP